MDFEYLARNNAISTFNAHASKWRMSHMLSFYQ